MSARKRIVKDTSIGCPCIKRDIRFGTPRDKLDDQKVSLSHRKLVDELASYGIESIDCVPERIKLG
jgi:hypothetical protein